MTNPIRTSLALWATAACALLSGCERPPVDSVQHGYRGTAMVQVYNPRTVAGQTDLNTLPAAQAPAESSGPKAGTVYQNVKLLGDLSVGEFNRHMLAITAWVSPKEGCTYCHAADNFADDGKYTKVVARRMIQMTQGINTDWKTHVADTGVTCYTCHRGNPVPANVWFKAEAPAGGGGLLAGKGGQNTPLKTVGLSSLPYDPFTSYLSGSEEIRVNGPTALPTGNDRSIQATEGTYGLMVHMSESLGVNCTYCHNSRAFSSWETSTPQRVTSWHGIRMARSLNGEYLEPLTASFPANRLGPAGDVAKINCATCHQGAYKPLYGQSMLKDHPELGSKVTVMPAAAAPAAAPAPAADTAAAAGGTAMVFFAVGSSALPADAAAGLDGLVAALKADPAAKVAVSGFHSASGDLAKNEELAKQRAFAVRDALQAAGIAADRVVLDKPQSAEANLAGEDPKARRVELALR